MHPAGWYPDPQVPDQLRWWDGTAWTTHVQATAPATQPATTAQDDPAATPPGTMAAGAVATMEPTPQRPRSTGLLIAIVAGIVALLVLAGVGVWLISDNLGGGTAESVTFQTQSSAEMADFAGTLATIGEDVGFTAEESFGFTDDPANSNLNFHAQACEVRAEVDHLEAIGGVQMHRSDGIEAVLGVGFGNDSEFDAMVGELIEGIDACRDGREIAPGHSLAPPRDLVTDDGHPAKVRFSTDVTSMGREQTMLLLIYADGPVGIQVVIAAPEAVDDATLDQLVEDAEQLLDASIAAIDDRRYVTPGR